MAALNSLHGRPKHFGYGGHYPPAPSTRSPHALSAGQMSAPVYTSKTTRKIPVWKQVQNQLAYRQVSEWFESWRPWQQKILLCGLTNRCSNQQLESLATTLEPLFHRDFLASLKKRYPSAPFRDVKQRADVTSHARALMLKAEQLRIEREKEKEAVLLGQIPAGGDENVLRTFDVYDVICEENISEDIPVRSESVVPPQIDHFAEEMAQTIIGDVIHSSEQDKIIEFSRNLANNIIAGAIEIFRKEVNEGETEGKQKEIYDNFDVLGNFVGNKSGNFPTDSQDSSHNQEIKDTSGNTREIKANDSPEKSGTRTSIANPENIMGREGTCDTIDRCEVNQDLDGELTVQSFELNVEQESVGDTYKFLSEQTHSIDATKVSPREEEVLVADHYDNPGLHHESVAPSRDGSGRGTSDRHASESSASWHSRVLLHHHRSYITSPDVKKLDFFSREKMLKLGPVKAGLRTGRVNCLPQLPDASVPVQKLFKNSKLWHHVPSEDHAYVRPRKSALKWYFRRQINQVWEWMEMWQDHERLALLVDIVKLCDQDSLRYLTQCLFQRLRERVDINWLPDRLLLLLFSYLNADNINTCAKVTRRWRYLCNQDELWMVKCHEYGLERGIDDMTELVLEANTDAHGIDWKLAYQELQTITDEAEAAVPIPRIHLSVEEDSTCSSQQTGSGRSTRTWKFSTRGSMASVTTKSSYKLSKLKASSFQTKSSSMEALPEIARRPTRKVNPFKGKGWGALASIMKKDEGSLSSKPMHLMLRRAKGSSSHLASLSGPHSNDQMSTVETGPSVTGTLTTEGENIMTNKPVQQWIRGQRRHSVGDLALDVRPEPVQCRDLLDLEEDPFYSLRFRILDEKEAEEKVKKSTGKIVAIKRCRKLQGHMDTVLCVEMDRCRLISGSMDRTIRIWDIRSGRSLHKLLGHKGGVCCLQFEGEVLYSGSWDMTIMVWDLVYFKRKAVLTGHNGSISCLKMCDSYIVSGSHDSTVRVWSRQTLTCMRVLREHTSMVTCMHYDGFTLITGSADKTIQMIDIHSGEVLNIFSGPDESVDELAVCRNLLVTCNPLGQVIFWTRNTGGMEAAIQAHNTPINCLAFHAGHLYTAANDGTVKEWDIMTLTCLRLLQGHKGPVQDFKVNSKYMVSCSTDGHIRIWDLSANKQTDSADVDIPMQVVTKHELLARSDLQVNSGDNTGFAD